MLQVKVVRGGRDGPYGGCYVYAPEHGLGVCFADSEDWYNAVALLLDSVEEKAKVPCILGDVTVKEQGQQNLIDNDPRVVVPPKPKKSRAKHAREGKRHPQQYSTPGYWENEDE